MAAIHVLVESTATNFILDKNIQNWIRHFALWQSGNSYQDRRVFRD